MSRFLQLLIRGGEWASVLATWAITLIVTFDVVARFLGSPTLWAMEISGYLMLGAAVLAAGETLRRGGHFDVRLFVEMLPPRVQAWLDLFVDLVSTLLVIALTVGAFQLLSQSFRFGFTSPTVLHVPLVYPQAVFLLGIVLLVIAYLARLAERIQALRHPAKAPADPAER